MMATVIRSTYLLAFLLAALASPVLAVKGPQNVSATIHNLSTSGPGASDYTTSETQVCIFCHTPHGGTVDTPLWNHQLPSGVAGDWVYYNSVTLTPSAKGIYATGPNLYSRLCLSCHDGAIATNRVINGSATFGTNLINDAYAPFDTEVPIMTLWGAPSAGIGDSSSAPGSTNNLSDDHPISIDYQGSINDGAALNSVAAATGAGVRFFNGMLECSSCHDPHVDYGTDTAYAPFLITSNAGSDLCLACHNK